MTFGPEWVRQSPLKNDIRVLSLHTSPTAIQSPKARIVNPDHPKCCVVLDDIEPELVVVAAVATAVAGV
jgi:hypothetical protein